jgi:hypothetical protein
MDVLVLYYIKFVVLINKRESIITCIITHGERISAEFEQHFSSAYCKVSMFKVLRKLTGMQGNEYRYRRMWHCHPTVPSLES